MRVLLGSACSQSLRGVAGVCGDSGAIGNFFVGGGGGGFAVTLSSFSPREMKESIERFLASEPNYTLLSSVVRSGMNYSYFLGYSLPSRQRGKPPDQNSNLWI